MESPPAGYQPPQPVRPNSGLAVASLIASILGLTLLPTVGSIVGLVMGYIAKRQIEESRGALGGEGMARAGIVVGWVGIGLMALSICIALIVFVVVGVGTGSLFFLEAG